MPAAARALAADGAPSRGRDVEAIAGPRPLTGVGLGLRWEFLDEVLAAEPTSLEPLRFFEVSPENYLRRGGYYPAALERVSALRPLTTHGLSLSLGGPEPLDPEYLADLARFLGRFGADWHSDHLAFAGLGGVNLHDLLPLPFTGAVARRVAARVREASERLERPLIVENITYYTALGRCELEEPAFIAEILERAGCGLLLDLNNLDVNAMNHGFDPWQWLARIPLDRVVEIHVAGPERHGSSLWLDTHGAPVRPSVLALLAAVVERTGPVPVLLERDHHVPDLAELMREVRALDVVYQAALARRASRAGAERAA